MILLDFIKISHQNDFVLKKNADGQYLKKKKVFNNCAELIDATVTGTCFIRRSTIQTTISTHALLKLSKTVKKIDG
jgi:hypothetical protein